MSGPLEDDGMIVTGMVDPDTTLRPERLAEDGDKALRPKGLDEFIGQEAARANLKVFIQSARQRGEAMDHALFHGPPGLGKTTLAQIMARELPGLKAQLQPLRGSPDSTWLARACAE